MPLTLLGTLPVSALNIGLAGSLPAISAAGSRLGLDIAGLTSALAAQVQLGLSVTAQVPNVTALAPALAGQLLQLPSFLDPLNWVTAGISANLGLELQLGLIEAELALVGTLAGQFQAGLVAPGIALWSYAGPAAGFGTGLALQTSSGWGTVGPSQHVTAVVIATESPSTWAAFGQGFNTGASGRGPAGPAGRLVYEGTFGGGELNTGVLQVSELINLQLLTLQGLKANVEAQIQCSLGLNLPSLSGLKASLKAIDPALAVEAMLTVHTDIAAEVGGLQAEIALLLKLSASIALQLSAGGLSAWSYSGPANGLGAALQGATVGGLPSGSGPAAPSYGVVLAFVEPAVAAAFGLVFKTS